MKTRIVSKFIAVGLVMLALEKTGSFAGPVEQILNDTRNAQFFPTTEDSLMVAISREHNANGGSTTNSVRGDLSATNHVAVSIFPDLTTIIPGKDITPEQVKDFADKVEKAGVDLSSPKVSIGTWFDADAGQTYLDVTATLPDRTKAVELGEKFNQKAVFDLSNFETIETGGTGEAEASMPSIKERMDTIILSSAKFKRSREQLEKSAREQEPFKTRSGNFKSKMENILGAYKIGSPLPPLVAA
jgi:hypothetical protein